MSAPAEARWRWSGGSVARWVESQRTPNSPHAIATTSPATGSQAVARKVTTVGPVTNSASSTTDSKA